MKNAIVFGANPFKPSYDVAGLKSTPASWCCVDCGFNTGPGAPNRADLIAGMAMATGDEIGRMVIDDTSEIYAVKTTVWQAADIDEGCLCIGCLESRIGRRLKPRDFDRKHPFADFPGTERLLSRRDGD